MASSRLKTTHDGKKFFELRYKPSRNRPELTTRWYVPEGWSQKAIDRGLAKAKAEFERQCKAGDILSRSEIKEREKAAAEAAAKIMTVQKYGEEVFMPAIADDCSENTRSSFQSNLNNHIYPVIGNKKLTDVTPADLSSLLRKFKATGKAHSSCVKVYTVLKLLFKMAKGRRDIEVNPMLEVARPKRRKEEIQKTEVERFSVDELKYIFKCLAQEPLKWQAIIRLLADTGIRRGEACGLKWEYVDFEDNTITIVETLNYTKDAGVYVSTAKNSRIRTIDVDPDVMALLKLLRKEQAETVMSSYVFTQDNSAEPIFPQSPTRYMEKFSKKYGVDHLHPHKLRHSFASIAITNGADVASIADILGHADPAVTLRVYSHADKESRRRASNIFREALQ